MVRAHRQPKCAEAARKRLLAQLRIEHKRLRLARLEPNPTDERTARQILLSMNAIEIALRRLTNTPRRPLRRKKLTPIEAYIAGQTG